MVFNWFRRQIGVNQTPKPEVSPEPEATPSEQSETKSPETDEVDYLSWAKAAYQNIQAKQGLATQSEEELSSVIETTVPDLPTEIETPPVATEKESVESEPPLELEPIAPSETEISEPIALTTPPETEISEPIAPPETEIPFWARSQTEREARVERLKSTAIVTPEPVIAETPVTPAPEEQLEEIPDLAFDEGFLWSAEVLAGQGRLPQDVAIEEITWLKRLRQGLDKTRRGLINQLKAIVGQGPLNQDGVTEIESLLLQADVGVEATDYIIEQLQEKLRSEVLPPEAAIAYLKQILRDILDQPLDKKAKGHKTYHASFAPEKEHLNIWLITGVNGAGKTTTIGKIAHLAHKSGYKCLIAASDTFRAAAVEQVKIWGDRSGTEIIANPGKNTDPAAVVFDAIAAAKSRQTELLLVDTAGRLQNKKNLMEELSKIRKIIDKKAPEAQVESLLVLDATLGQNGLRQAQVFSEAAQLSGVVLTKLDGTAKGGVALAVVQELGLPIRFIGAGEGIEDLRPFSSYEFVEAMLSS